MLEGILLLVVAVPISALVGFILGYRLRTRASLELLLRSKEEREARLEAERQLKSVRELLTERTLAD